MTISKHQDASFGVWQPISTAPQDGTVILTDEGTACYVNQRYWASPVTSGWYLCAIDSQPNWDCDEDMADQALSPTYWMSIPAVPGRG